jgi:ATP-binding cassette subfamily C protein CydD
MSDAVSPKAFLKQLNRADLKGLSVAKSVGLIQGVCVVLQAYALTELLNRVVFEGQGILDNLGWLALFAGLIVMRSLLSGLREYAATQASLKVRASLRTRLFDVIHQQGPVVATQRSRGAWSHLLVEQVDALDGWLARYLPQQFLASIVPVIVLCAVFPVNWMAGLILLLTAPLVPVFMILVGKKAAKANQENFEALAHLSAFFLDIVRGLPTLKLFDRSKVQARAVEGATTGFRIKTMQVLRLAFLSSAVLEFFASISIALVAVYLGMTFLGYLNIGPDRSELTYASALFVLLLAPEFYLPLRELGVHYHAKAQAEAAIPDIAALLDKDDQALESALQKEASQERLPEGVVPQASNALISLKDVSYRYAEDQPWVLKNANFALQKGEAVAIMGPSGSGKSTLLSLMMGFITPEHGQVLVRSGESLADVRDEWAMDWVWLRQDPVLVFGSVKENLQVAKPNASDDELWRTLERAGLKTEIQALPQGVDTAIGEGGTGLSGGQVQRLCIARALLKEASVWFLDEPTAHLDQHSEKIILDTLASLKGQVAMVWLTHRTAGLDQVDRVLHLKGGQLYGQS